MIRGLGATAALALAALCALGPTGGAQAVQAVEEPTTPAASPLVNASGRAPVGAGNLQVRIDSVSPSIPQAGGRIEISGSIANSSEVTVRDIRAVLRISATPVPSRGEIAEVLSGGGTRMGQPARGPGASADLADQLTPGQAVPFTVFAQVDDLPLDAVGAYVVGVEALGTTGAGRVRQDLDRSFLPWWPEGTTATPLLLTTLWPIVGAPLRDAQGVLLSERPAVEMSPGGRLATLLSAVDANPGVASIVFDPQVLEAADDMAAGYLVRQGSQSVTGARSREATNWLAAARSVADDPDQDVHTMLYGLPDVVAARDGRAMNSMLRLRPLVNGITRQALGVRRDSDVVLVPGGAADERTLDTLTDRQVGVTVLADTAMPASPATFFTPSGNVSWSTEENAMPVLLADSRLSATLAMPLGSAAERVAARQRLLAETLVTVTELPSTQRLLVAAPQADWSPPAAGSTMVLSTIASAPWITPTSLDAATERPPGNVTHRLAPYTDAQREAQIPDRLVARTRQQTRNLAAYTEALTNPEHVPTVARTAPARMLSGWFRSHEEQHRALSDQISSQLSDLLESVRVVSSGPVTVAGSTGTIPVTIENLGGAAVTVGLTLTGTPSQVFTALPVEPFRIDPGRRTSVEVQVEVKAAGPIPVTIQVTTAAGDAFGVPGQLTVASSAYANAARILVQVSLALLLVAVLVHGVRRARKARALARNHQPQVEPGTPARVSSDSASNPASEPASPAGGLPADLGRTEGQDRD